MVQALGVEVERQQDFRFILLEIADLHSMPQEIDARESHWKAVLMTRTFGYNLNLAHVTAWLRQRLRNHDAERCRTADALGRSLQAFPPQHPRNACSMAKPLRLSISATHPTPSAQHIPLNANTSVGSPTNCRQKNPAKPLAGCGNDFLTPPASCRPNTNHQ